MWTLDTGDITLDAGIRRVTLDGLTLLNPTILRDVVLGSRVLRTIVVGSRVQKIVKVQKRLSKDVKVGGVTNVI